MGARLPTWRPVLDEVTDSIGEALYEVSDLGGLRSRTGTSLYVETTRKGYKRAELYGFLRRKVHHLVLEAFVGPRLRGQVCRHLNDDPGDNRLENLVWGTQRENVADAKRNRLRVLGAVPATASKPS